MREFVNVGLKLALFLLPAFFSTIDYVGAACQTYRSDPAFLADLQTDDFMVRVFPRASPQSPEEKQKLNAMARERRPEHIGDLAQMEGFWRLVTGAPLPFQITMPARMEWRMREIPVPVPDPVKIEFDADGDGKPELVHEASRWAELTYSYNKEGDYESVVRIHDRSGKIHTYKTWLRIVSSAALDSQLQTVWREFKEALRRGDVTAAIECIHTQSRNRYSKALAAIPDLSKKVDEIFSAIRFVEHHRGTATYEMLRTEGNKTFSYPVGFVAEFDAVWRIRTF